MKIKTQLFLLIIFFVIFFFVIMGINIRFIVQSTKEHQTASAELLINQSETYIEQYLQRIDKIARQLQNNYSVQQFFWADKWGELIDAEQELSSTARSVLNTGDNITGVFFQGADRKVNYSAHLSSMPFQEKTNRTIWYTDLYAFEERRYYYCIVPISATIEPNVTYQLLGYAVIELSPSIYSSVFNRYLPSENAAFLLLDGNQQVVASNIEADESLLAISEDLPSGKFIDQIQGKQYLCISNQIQPLNYQILYLLPYSDIIMPGIQMAALNAAVFGVFFLFSIGIAYMIIRGILSPIQQISAFARKSIYNRQKFNMKIPLKNELRPMVDSLNWMLEQKEESTNKILKTQQKLYEAEQAEKQAKLDSLRSQIHPHFLYNTLECIRSIANTKGIEEIEVIAASMAQMFRYSINGGSFTTLQDELDIIRAYFQIISIRFRGKYEIEINCPQQYLQYRIPKMMLQPLVENAVIHGLEKRRGKGKVLINCQTTENLFQIQVLDNGRGMETEELKQLQHNLKEPDSGHSIGILNTASRIQNSYREPAGIYIESKRDYGTTVTIQLLLDEVK